MVAVTKSMLQESGPVRKLHNIVKAFNTCIASYNSLSNKYNEQIAEILVNGYKLFYDIVYDVLSCNTRKPPPDGSYFGFCMKI